MLVPCRICGKDVGEVAPKCLHCGTLVPNRERKSRVNILLVNIIIMAILLVIHFVWVIKYPPEPQWVNNFFILISCTSFIISAWCLYKTIADLFK